MSFFEFPHTRTYDSDLGWLITITKQLIDNSESLNAWRATHEAEYKNLLDKVNGLINNLIDVIVPWDSSVAYQIYTIVEYQGQNYIALQNVPVGVMITNADYWQPASTVIEQLNAISVSVQSIKLNLNFVTPEMFGAVGDGVTDDAAAIQAAINTDECVHFGEKVYAIGAPIVIDQRNASTGTRRVIDFGQSTIVPLDALPELVRVEYGAEGFTLKNGHFNCNSLTQYGINFTGTIYGTYIIGAFVENALDTCIKIAAGHHNWIIDCKIYNRATFATGVYTAAVDTKIVNTEIYYTNNAIISGANIIIVTNCHLWAGGVENETEATYAISWDTTNNNRLFAADCYIDSFKYGVYINGDGNITMSSSLFYVASTATGTDFVGVYIPDNQRSTYDLNGCIFQSQSDKTLVPIQKGAYSLPIYNSKLTLIDSTITSIKSFVDTLPIGIYNIMIPENISATDLPPFTPHKLCFITVYKYSVATVKLLAVSAATSNNIYSLTKYGNTWENTWKLLDQGLQNEINLTLRPSATPITVDINSDIQNSGYYRLSSASTNIPTAANGLLQRTVFSDTVMWDKYITSSGRVYERVKWTTWQPWIETTN